MKINFKNYEQYNTDMICEKLSNNNLDSLQNGFEYKDNNIHYYFICISNKDESLDCLNKIIKPGFVMEKILFHTNVENIINIYIYIKNCLTI